MFPSHRAAPRKKEGWVGVFVTTLLCGGFLWWWFQPAPVSAETQRDPLYWVGLAREAQHEANPTLPQRLEIIMIAEALRQHGETEPAFKIEADWLPPSWRPPSIASSDPPEDVVPFPPNASGPGPLTPVLTALADAHTAFDLLEIERGQAVLREAAATASALPDPDRIPALWLVAARQARSGLAADAVETRKRLPPVTNNAGFPDWLVPELMEGDIVAPVVATLSGLPADHPKVIAFASLWRTLVRDRLIQRDRPFFTRHGPGTDASTPPESPDASTLWAAVEGNRLGEAHRLAGTNPSARLAVARLLAWLAVPPP